MLTATLTHSLRARPFFDWYALSDAQPPALLLEGLSEFGIEPGETILDPFCRDGASLLAAKLLGINAIGWEGNPFLHFAARAKTRPYSDLPRLRSEIEGLLSVAERSLDKLDSDGDMQWRVASKVPEMPRLQQWLATRVLWKVLALRECIEDCVRPEYRDLPLLALAAVLRGASQMKLSPHAYGSRESKPYSPVLYHFDAKLRKMLADLEGLDAQGELGDVRVLNTISGAVEASEEVSLAVATPPDLCSADETVQTRLELFFLGYVHGVEELARLREQLSFLSAPALGTLRLPEVAAIESVAAQLDEKKGNGTGLRNYFGNLLLSMEAVRVALKPGAPLLLSIGESVHSGVPVPVPDLAAALSGVAGFSSAEVRVHGTRRHPAVRGGLKDSVVLLKK